ncbi:hypothetical protein GGX14DRAFT_392114 [Mycena pura]|uniref:Uncharacterized protein n=1 Tax=Mycena pura TaxID=153505 RepID=A0AAD6VJC7_9AGAR|nr:hypothetical protein GGX14DRAFT_392114 [Mycena pura]
MLASSKYQYRWDNWAKFLEWLSQEQQHECIELRLVNIAGTGGVKDLNELAVNAACWSRSTLGSPPFWATIPMCTTIRLGTRTFPIHTQIPKETKEYIAGLLRLKVSPEHILKLVHRGVYDSDDIFEQDLDDASVAARTEFIQLRDIRALRKDRLCDVQNTLRVPGRLTYKTYESSVARN